MRLSCALIPSPREPEQAALAERLGYERVWLADSPALYGDVWIAVAEAARATRRIGLGTSVLIPSLRHVLATAAAIAHVEAIAPGFTDSIRHRQVIGPYEMEHEYGLVGGNIFHGELSPGQLFHMRPAPGYADFRTPIAGLYQASSATHGGGGVTGIPGMNAAAQVWRDRRRARWRRA